MSLSNNPAYEKALILDNHLKELKEEEITKRKLKLKGGDQKVMRKKRIKKKKTIEPCGTIIPAEDYFKFKSENIGIFKKPEIERNDDPK